MLDLKGKGQSALALVGKDCRGWGRIDAGSAFGVAVVHYDLLNVRGIATRAVGRESGHPLKIRENPELLAQSFRVPAEYPPLALEAP